MIIALDKDRQTNQSMGSLLALYGVDEGTRTYTDMLRAKSYNLKRAEDVTAHENPTISRIALRANYNDILTDSDSEESSKDDALSQLKDLEEQIKPLLTNRQLIGNQIVELIAASEQIVPPTKEPRETLDSLDFCCFSVAPSATHSLTASVAATHDNTINSSSWEPNTIISEAKDGDGHITQQEMKDTMARLRAEGKKIQSTNDDEQQVSSIPGFSAGSDSKDK